jgi:hypothetical protein
MTRESSPTQNAAGVNVVAAMTIRAFAAPQVDPRDQYFRVGSASFALD